MNMSTDLVDVKHRIFIGLPIPENVITAVQGSFQEYQQYITRPVVPEKWHLTLLHLGEVNNPKQYYSRLRKQLTSSFVPTVRITHVGRGLNKHQLWAYAEPSVSLKSMRSEIIKRLKSMRFQFQEKAELADDFVPHITIANLFRMTGGVGLADYPLTLSFTVNKAHIYRSDLASDDPRYNIEDTIPFTQ